MGPIASLPERAGRLRGVRLGLRRSGRVVALDIGPDAIVAVEREKGSAGTLTRAVMRPLPVAIVADGEVASVEGLAAELRAMVAEHGLGRDVRVGLAHPRLIVRTVELPLSLDGPDLDAAVRHMAAELLPMPLTDVVLDHRIVGIASTADGELQRVLIAAARLDGVERLLQALDLAGLRAEQVQLAGAALLRALPQRRGSDGAVLYVQAGALTNVVVAEHGEPVLVRAASAGSEAIAAELAERLGVGHAAARRHIAEIGLGDGPAGMDAAGDLVPTVQRVVREGVRRVAAEVQSSLEFFSARPGARPVGAAVLTGSLTAVPGVAEALRAELGVPVVAPPRAGWDAGSDAEPGGAGHDLAPARMDVAAGLALAGPAERPDLRPARRRRAAGRDSAPRVAQAACAVLAILAAAIVYLVVLSNGVTSGEQRAGELTADVAAAQRQATALKPYADFASDAAARGDAVRTVAEARFDWERALRQLARVTPAEVWLTGLKGTLRPGVDVAGGTGGADALRAARAMPALELSGCATDEKHVPELMDRLRGLDDMTDVGFSRSERLHRGQGAGAKGGDDCRDGDERAPRFDLVTFFAAPAGAAAVAPAGAPAPAPTGAEG